MQDICKGAGIRSYGNGNYYLEVHDGNVRETHYEVNSEVLADVAVRYRLDYVRLKKTIEKCATPQTCSILIIPDLIREGWAEEDKKLLPPLPPVGDFVQLDDGGVLHHAEWDVFINAGGAMFHWNEIASRVISHGSIHWRDAKGGVE